jgi:hypothetical protein
MSGSSEAILFDAHGRVPIGIAQQLGRQYPLLSPSADIEYLLADAWLSYEDPADYDSAAVAFSLPFRMAWLYGLGSEIGSVPGWVPVPAHAVDAIVQDAADRDVFNSTTATYNVQHWSDWLDIHEWTTDTATLRLVVHTRWPPGSPTPRDYALHLVPESAILAPRTCSRRPKRVKGFIVGLTTLRGAVQFSPGFNVVPRYSGRLSAPAANTLRDAATTLQAGHRITFDGTPGGGLGRSPACEGAEVVLKTINRKGPDTNGNLQLAATGCLWFERPIVQVGANQFRFVPATLQLHNSCKPCCDCDSYVQTAIDNLAMYDRWLELARQSERVRNSYAAARTRWLNLKECIESKRQQLILEAHPDGYVAVLYAYCNTGDGCDPLSVTFTVDGPVDRLVLLTAYCRKNGEDSRLGPYIPTGSLPEVVATWDVVDSRNAAQLYMLLKVCNPTAADAITVTAVPSLAGGSVSESITVNPMPYATPCEDGP